MSPDRKRQTHSEKPTQAEQAHIDASKHAWGDASKRFIEFTNDSDSGEFIELAENFVDGMATNRFVFRWGDRSYKVDQPPFSSWQKPYGIEVPTFGQGMKVALNGIILYKEGLFDDLNDQDIDEMNKEFGDEAMSKEEVDEFKQKTINEGPPGIILFS